MAEAVHAACIAMAVPLAEIVNTCTCTTAGPALLGHFHSLLYRNLLVLMQCPAFALSSNYRV